MEDLCRSFHQCAYILQKTWRALGAQGAPSGSTRSRGSTCSSQDFVLASEHITCYPRDAFYDSHIAITHRYENGQLRLGSGV
jgi:hypothetical protein